MLTLVNQDPTIMSTFNKANNIQHISQSDLSKLTNNKTYN